MRTPRRTTVRSRFGTIFVVASMMLASLALAPAASATTAVRHPLSFFAGTGVSGAPTAGTASSSKLNAPSGVAVDSSGNVYIADYSNNLVEKVTPDGTLSVFAGNGLTGAATAGAATSSAVDRPNAVAVDSNGNVFIVTPQRNRVLKVTSDGTLSVFAGNGSSARPTPGPATSSGLPSPQGLAVDSIGNVYIAVAYNYVVVAARYTFYLAQSLRDAGNAAGAEMAYRARASMGGWPEEVYVSLLWQGRLLRTLRRPLGESLEALARAQELCPARAEAWCEAATQARAAGLMQLAHACARRASECTEPVDGLFLETDCYRWRGLYEFALAAFYGGDLGGGARACHRLFYEDLLPVIERQAIVDALAFYPEDAFTYA